MDASRVCWIAAAARLRARRWQKSVIPIENDHCIRWILESRIFNAFPRFLDSQGYLCIQRLPVSFFRSFEGFLFFHVQSSKDFSYCGLACCFTAISSSVLLCAVHTKTAFPLQKQRHSQINDDEMHFFMVFPQGWAPKSPCPMAARKEVTSNEKLVEVPWISPSWMEVRLPTTLLKTNLASQHAWRSRFPRGLEGGVGT